MKVWEDSVSMWTSSRLGAMKLTVGLPTPRVNRKVMKGLATKRTAVGQQRLISARTQERTTVDPCDNSNDSGLGFDHHLEFQQAARSTVRFADQEGSWVNEHSEVKRKKLEIKLESDDANDNFTFPETMSRRDKKGEETERVTPRTGEALGHSETASVTVARTQGRPQAIVSRRCGGVTLASQLMGMSRDGKTHLQILCQPEQQHRARYQTEGSRGAVKDRSGNGFPVVKLVGYNKPATLQVFIGTDVGRVAPHMFYQACRVSGKNSTPCMERKIDGTIVIEVDFDPGKDMVITCDCVGILKERNVDVEHRFPDQSGSRNKKKSTRCRMVFRTTITHPDGTTEILQTTSQPIVCTQPPGVPEICKKSLSGCPCTGGMELFILGKNFLKDTRVVFQHGDALSETPWEESVQPDKEFLQQTHLVCVVPPYRRVDLTDPVTVRLVVVSSGKTSEPHTFIYTPTLQPPAVVPGGTQPCVTLVQSAVSHPGAEVSHVFARSTLVPGSGLMLPDTGPNPIVNGTAKSSPKKIGETEVHPVMMWQSSSVLPLQDTSKVDNRALEPKELDRVLRGRMMPPPLLPIGTRRASSNLRLIVPDADPASLMPEKLKTELTEETNGKIPEDVKGIDLRMKPIATVADLSSTQSPTMATFRQFVTGSTSVPLPNQSAHSVEKYLSNLEHATDTSVVAKPTSNHLASSCKIADPAAPTASQICLSTHTGNPSQFDSTSALFGQQQSATATSTGTVDPKLQYASDLPMPLLYSAQTTVTMAGQECKPQFSVEQATLLQQASAVQRKSMFDNTLTITPTAESVIGGMRPIMIMQESQNVENQISSNNACSTLVESLDQNVSMMNTVSEAPDLLQTSSSLMYGSPERGAISSLHPASTQSAEASVLDSLSKGSNSVGIDNSVHDSSLLSAPQPILGDQMLAVTQPSIITSSQSARLDALVSSAMNSHVLGSGNHVQSSDTEKLDALVNSAAVSHMIPTSADDIMLSTPVQAPLRQQDVASADQMASIPIKKMPDAGLGSFDLMPTEHSNTQISQESAQLLNSAMSAALNEHLLATSSQAQVQADAQLSITTPTVSSIPGSTVYTSHGQTSPVVLKDLILNSSIATTAERQILVARPTCTSPADVKNMILGSPDALPHNQILASSSTSPIAVKKMVAVASPESQVLVAGTANAPIESIMNASITQQGNGQVIVTSPACTSPIAIKTMILESATSDPCLANPAHTSPIAVKTMILNSQLSGSMEESLLPMDESLLPRTTQSAHISEENARLDALVQSTLNGHAFVSSATQVTPAMDIHTGDGITILSQQAHVQQSCKAPSTASLISQPPACITTLVTQPSEPSSHLSVPAVTTGDALINTIFTTSRSPTNQNSHVETHCFNNEEVVIVGTDSQTPCCTGGSALLHASQFTTASSNSQSLLTGITMSSKVAEELVAQSRNSSPGFVTQMLLGLAADGKMKKDSEISCMSRDKTTESLQCQTNFSESKLPEARLFAAPEMLKAAVGDVPNSCGQSQVTAMNGLVITKEQSQEVQEQQCKRQQHSAMPQTTTCVTEPTATTPGHPQKKGEEGMVPQELTQMSENDLLSYINPSAFDQV
ncbi:nuclear factor of activated T-cells 5 isoform X2 [Zootermopsis nevadensis]|uniref:nuclear factor of activated T-cells 5 isoform X2 n=1 Tax=Zootermopsis nevadensis TaxID=136037 RepID=UPI000B8EA282|nr:nuclear factor of activated T-cells 5 isoform X2 [Zootermopsis nevadensis]